MLTLTAHIAAISTRSGGAEIALVVHGETLEVETTLDVARAIGSHLGEDLELVLRVPGAEPITPSAPPETTAGAPETQETPCADREAGGGPDQPRTVTDTPGRERPARASKGATKGPCASCGATEASKWVRGLCGSCYERARRDAKQRKPRRRSLKRLVTQLGATETAKRLGIETLLLGRYPDGVEDIPGDVAQTIAREQSIITRAAKRRRAGQEAPVFADPPTRAETLAGAQRP